MPKSAEAVASSNASVTHSAEVDEDFQHDVTDSELQGLHYVNSVMVQESDEPQLQLEVVDADATDDDTDDTSTASSISTMADYELASSVSSVSVSEMAPPVIHVEAVERKLKPLPVSKVAPELADDEQRKTFQARLNMFKGM